MSGVIARAAFQFSTYLRKLGKKKGIVGSFTPHNDLCFEWEQIREVLPPPEWNDIYGDNLLRLLQKRGAL